MYSLLLNKNTEIQYVLFFQCMCKVHRGQFGALVALMKVTLGSLASQLSPLNVLGLNCKLFLIKFSATVSKAAVSVFTGLPRK